MSELPSHSTDKDANAPGVLQSAAPACEGYVVVVANVWKSSFIDTLVSGVENIYVPIEVVQAPVQIAQKARSHAESLTITTDEPVIDLDVHVLDAQGPAIENDAVKAKSQEENLIDTSDVCASGFDVFLSAVHCQSVPDAEEATATNSSVTDTKVSIAPAIAVSNCDVLPSFLFDVAEGRSLALKVMTTVGFVVDVIGV